MPALEMSASESVNSKIAVRAGAAGMNDALGDALMIEVVDLFAEDEIFEQGRTALAGLERVFIVGDDMPWLVVREGWEPPAF